MDKDAKTLLILTPGFPENEADTTCLPSQQLFVRALNKVNPRMKIIILTLEYPFFKGSYQWYGNTVFSFNGWKKNRSGKLDVYLSVWKRLQKLRKENNVFGLLGFWCTAGSVLATYFGRLHKLPHFSWILGQDAKKTNKYVRKMAPRAGELIAMSDFLAGEFEKNHRVRPANIIPNAIEPDTFPPPGEIRDIDLLGVGSLIPLKHFDVFIDLVCQLSQSLPGLKAVICGKGPDREALDLLIQKAGMQDHIEMTGEKSHEETLALMQRSRILLHPSSYEGFSTVCLEALYAGAQVISFCNPKNVWIRHWHIVTNAEEMKKRALDLLTDREMDHDPVLVHTMTDQAMAMLRLFQRNVAKRD